MWYGRDPELIYLQLTNSQSLILVVWGGPGGGGDPKFHCFLSALTAGPAHFSDILLQQMGKETFHE